MSNKLTPQNTSLNFVCPKCKTKLEVDNNNYFCCLCQRHYYEILGLRDFRLSFKDSENQIELAHEFVASWDKLTYEDMVHMRFSGLRKRALEKGKNPSDFKMWDADEKSHISSYKIRGKRHLNILKNILKKRAQTIHINRMIDVGCGWGRDLLHLSSLATEVIGIDVSVYSLLMTKKLLEEQGVANVNLILSEGETLPIQPESIDGINCSATIEHMKNPSDFLCESSRCLNDKGWLFLYYPNRFSILPETHTGIWGLGYFSASRQKKIVHNKKGGNWDTFLFSRSDFKKILKSNFKYKEFYITGIPPGIEDFLITSKFSKMYPHLMAFATHFLPFFRKVPGLERFASFFCPVHFVIINR
jgi:ubiquinone/menaquinone biosynthesis C-methylase UbiE